MAKQRAQWQWVRVRTLTAEEKADIATACERVIREVFKPQCLPQIRPTSFNYPIDIFGRWRGNKYSFIMRYRSGFSDNTGEEFDSAFTRLDHIEEHTEENRFNVMMHRYTGQWWCLHGEVPFDEALHLIATDELLRPPI